MPEHFFCQSCRVALADPFWQADGVQLIPPALLRVEPGRPVTISATGKEKSLAASRGFFLSPSQLDPLRKNSQTEQLHVSAVQDVTGNHENYQGTIKEQESKLSSSMHVVLMLSFHVTHSWQLY